MPPLSVSATFDRETPNSSRELALSFCKAFEPLKIYEVIVIYRRGATADAALDVKGFQRWKMLLMANAKRGRMDPFVSPQVTARSIGNS